MQSHTFKGTARRIVKDNETGTTSYIYHTTAIVGAYSDDTIRLNSGGWRTATTKNAMNQVSNQFGYGFSVYQQNHEWLVTWKGETLPFEDGMFLN